MRVRLVHALWRHDLLHLRGDEVSVGFVPHTGHEFVPVANEFPLSLGRGDARHCTLRGESPTHTLEELLFGKVRRVIIFVVLVNITG
jgi:hypothetical protein